MVASFMIHSLAFEEGGVIPSKYTCDGENVSPALYWSGVPQGTQTFALIVDDPDAPKKVFVHWVLFNIPSETRQLEERSPAPFKHGVNDYQETGYKGPCPPSGVHRYYFTLYALDTSLKLPEDVTKESLLAAMEGHILGKAVTMGRYQRNH